MSYNPDKLKAIFEAASQTDQSETTMDGFTTALDALIADEYSGSKPDLIPEPLAMQVRDRSIHGPMSITPTARAFAVTDENNNQITIVLEANWNDSQIEILGELHSRNAPEWQNANVLMYRNGVLEDYVTLAAGSPTFSLMTAEQGLISLRFLASNQQTIALNNLEIILE